MKNTLSVILSERVFFVGGDPFEQKRKGPSDLLCRCCRDFAVSCDCGLPCRRGNLHHAVGCAVHARVRRGVQRCFTSAALPGRMCLCIGRADAERSVHKAVSRRLRSGNRAQRASGGAGRTGEPIPPNRRCGRLCVSALSYGSRRKRSLCGSNVRPRRLCGIRASAVRTIV